MDSIITVKNLVKSFKSGESELVVLKGLELSVPKGQFLSITGRSGSGKSTLLYQLGLLDHPNSGDISIDGIDISKLNNEQRTKFRLNKLGYVFQDYALIPELTAMENVALPLLMQGYTLEDARRIDNQLRGRSGRQGDPGETQFFVSMEDHIMRVFAADTVKKMMGRLGIPEDEAIQNKLITKSLESAQQKIEGLNFDARKHILEYDDVLNFQRKIFYERRRNVLENEKDERVRGLKLQAFDMFWVEHLEMMDYLRNSVNLRAYGQRDPLVEYKREGLRLFKEMEQNIENTVAENLKKLEEFGNTKVEADPAIAKAMTEAQNQALKITGVTDSAVVSSNKEVGRNDPCWCGSGKKFKKCHGA
jgi:preprotein translocase subunit SecA